MQPSAASTDAAADEAGAANPAAPAAPASSGKAGILYDLLPIYVGFCRVGQGSCNRIVAAQWGLAKTALLSMGFFLIQVGRLTAL